MRVGRFIWVILLIGSAALAAPHASPEARARARSLIETGVTLERLGQNRQAIDVLTQAILSGALARVDAARAVYDRGVAYDALGNTKAAIADYSSALQLDPALAPALNNRANANRRVGRLDEAKRDYLAALRHSGAAREYSYYGLGLIAEKLGDAENARDYFHKALAANPSFALAAQSLSTLDKPSSSTRQIKPQVRIAAPPGRPAAPPDAPASVGDLQRPALRQTISEVGGRGHAAVVQLGAFRDQQSAQEGWNKAVAAAAGALDGQRPTIVVVNIPNKGLFWRLRTSMGDKAAARRLCVFLTAQKQPCMLVWDLHARARDDIRMSYRNG